MISREQRTSARWPDWAGESGRTPSCPRLRSSSSWSIRSAAGTTTSASPSPTAATSAAPTACRRTSSSSTAPSCSRFEEIAHFVRVAAGAGRGQGPAHRRRAADAQGPAQARAACSPPSPASATSGLTTNGILLADQAAGAFRRRAAAAERLARHARPRPLPRTDPPRRRSRRCWPGWRPRSGPGSTRSRSTRSPSAGSPSTTSCRWPATAASTASSCGSSSTCRSGPRRGSATRSSSPTKSWT